MAVIHKLGPINIAQTFEIPGRFGYFGVQNNKLYVWFQPDDQIQVFDFQIVGTGWTFSDTANYVATVVDEDGFVWHLISQMKNSS